MKRAPVTPSPNTDKASNLHHRSPPKVKHEWDSKKKGHHKSSGGNKIWGTVFLAACIVLASHVFTLPSTQPASYEANNSNTPARGPPKPTRARVGNRNQPAKARLATANLPPKSEPAFKGKLERTKTMTETPKADTTPHVHQGERNRNVETGREQDEPETNLKPKEGAHPSPEEEKQNKASESNDAAAAIKAVEKAQDNTSDNGEENQDQRSPQDKEDAQDKETPDESKHRGRSVNEHSPEAKEDEQDHDERKQGSNENSPENKDARESEREKPSGDEDNKSPEKNGEEGDEEGSPDSGDEVIPNKNGKARVEKREEEGNSDIGGEKSPNGDSNVSKGEDPDKGNAAEEVALDADDAPEQKDVDHSLASDKEANDSLNQEPNGEPEEHMSVTAGQDQDSPMQQSPAVPLESVNSANKTFAYAFFLGGIPSLEKDYVPSARRHDTKKARKDDYRGFLYNILVSVKILRDAGSKADFVLLVHMADAASELPDEDVRLLTEMGVKIKYTPPTPEMVNEFMTVPFEKFRVLDLVEYSRVLYMDPDVTPRCNLDYIMEMSIEGILQKNLLVSMGDTPVSSKFFMLTPGPGYFFRFLWIIPSKTKDVGVRTGWKPTVGWGHHETKWKSLNGGRGTAYTFEGGNSDQGMLLEWTKYTMESVTIVVGDKVENWRRGDPTSAITANEHEKFREMSQKYAKVRYILNNPLQEGQLKEHSCLAEEVEKEIRKLYDEPAYAPHGVAPYRDFDQWNFKHDGKNLYPWNWDRAPAVDSKAVGAGKWFHVLRQLDKQLDMNLGFTVDSSITEQEANWNHIPVASGVPFDPMWSHGVKALRQWALRLVDTSEGYLPWEPPTVMANETFESATVDLKEQCQCTATAIDLCSNSNESVEDWLNRRVPYYLSRQRPLCPRAARNQIHVVIPFHDSVEVNLRSKVCSIACQDYPAEKISIFVYDDGSTASWDGIESVCGKDQVMEFQPIKVTKAHINRKGGDAGLIEHAAKSGQKLARVVKKDASGISTTCIKAKEHLGSAGASYWALKLVRAYAETNDVVVLAEAGELSKEASLELINYKYIEKGAWVTYGSSDGDQISAAIPDHIGPKRFSPRKRKKPSWRFGPPFTFKAHLIDHVGVTDFTYKDGSWLMEAANRGYALRMMETAGPDRIGYISEPIFSLQGQPAKTDGNPWTHLTHLESLEESKRMNTPLQVVMLCSQHSEVLTDQLGWLQDQELTKRRTIVLHLLCGESDLQKGISKAVGGFKATNQHSVNAHGRAPFHINLVQRSDIEELGEFTRVVYVDELRRSEVLEQVVFLDSDQYFGPTCIGTLLQIHLPTNAVSLYGKAHSQRDTPGHVRFDASSLSEDELFSGEVKGTDGAVRSFSHSAHGGIVFDANLWLLDQHLLRPKDSLKEFVEAGDVWVSYVMDAFLGWDMKRQLVSAKAPLFSISLFGKKNFVDKNYAQLPQDTLSRLQELSKLYQTNSQSARDQQERSKAKFFSQLQTKFHWNVARIRSMPMREAEVDLMPVSHYLTQTSSASESVSNPQSQRRKLREKKKRRKRREKRLPSMRAFVCVTGQFSRFELDSKINNFFKPMRDAGFAIDAALVVSNGTAIFTNKKTKKNDTVPFYSTFDAAVNDLKKAEIDVVSSDGAYPTLEDPPVKQSYVEFLTHSQEGRTFQEQKARAQNHARIFDSYRRCLDYADKAAVEAGKARAEDHYDVFVRIRDDVGVRYGLDKTAIKDVLPPPQNSIIVTPCRNWKGMNDRFAIVSPDVARTYFTRPSSYFFEDLRIYDPGAVRNPESFLLYSYTIKKIHVLSHPKVKRLCRMYKTIGGEAKFLLDDVKGERCPKPDPFRPRLYSLYGWDL